MELGGQHYLFSTTEITKTVRLQLKDNRPRQSDTFLAMLRLTYNKLTNPGEGRAAKLQGSRDLWSSVTL
jgi:hypothetical protein